MQARLAAVGRAMSGLLLRDRDLIGDLVVVGGALHADAEVGLDPEVAPDASGTGQAEQSGEAGGTMRHAGVLLIWVGERAAGLGRCCCPRLRGSRLGRCESATGG